MKVVVIDYGAGNLFSVKQAFERLGVQVLVSFNEVEIRSASHVVFPGVGHAKKAMEELRKAGMDKVIPTLKQPVLGICLGMQLMCERTEEGNVEGLGIFETRVFDLKNRISEIENSEKSEFEKIKIRELENSIIRKFDKYRRSPVFAGIQGCFSAYKFPHMGWNDVKMNEKNEAFYFVHSYAAELCPQTIGITEYPLPFSSALRKDNFLGVQFHPEKSGRAGEELLIQFLRS